MREILFRGKRLDNGEWVEGAYCPKNCDSPFGPMVDKPSIIKLDWPYDGSWFDVDPNTVGQFTGLCDENGKKIFEGDIIYGINWMNSGRIYQMLYEDSGFYCFNDNGHTFHPDHITNMKVVGNIHDEQEAMKGE